MLSQILLCVKKIQLFTGPPFVLYSEMEQVQLLSVFLIHRTDLQMLEINFPVSEQFQFPTISFLMT